MSSVRFGRFVSDGRPWLLARDGAGLLVDELLLDLEREFPVVGVSTHPHFGRSLVDPVRLAQELRGRALVAVIPHGRVSRIIEARLGRGLAVYGGFARIWRPGLCRNSSADGHKLFPVHDDAEGDRVLGEIVLSVCHGLQRPAIRSRSPVTDAGGFAKGPASRSGVHVPFDPAGPMVAELGWWSCRGF
jgi:hypothetical protein